KSPDASAADRAFAPVDRALVLVETGKYRDAVTQSGIALATATAGQLPAGTSDILRRVALGVTASAQARLGDTAGVDKSVAALQQASSVAPNDPNLTSAVHFAQGMQAVAHKDLKA